jgi:hypothetical protein
MHTQQSSKKMRRIGGLEEELIFRMEEGIW